MKPFPLSFSTLPCEGWGPELLAETCRTLGFTGLELREDRSSWFHLGMEQADCRRYTALFQKNGIAVTDIGSSICVRGENQSETDAALSLLKEYIRLASSFHAAGIRIFLGNFTRRLDDARLPLNHGGIVRFLRSACELARQAGVGVWVETHNEYATGAVLRRLIEEVDRVNLGIIWDALHPLEDGEPPQTTVSLIGGSIVHVHMKDGFPSPDPLDHDWTYTVIGEGAAPLREIVSSLIGIGYTGSYSLEWETKWRVELQAPHLRAELILPHYARYKSESAYCA